MLTGRIILLMAVYIAIIQVTPKCPQNIIILRYI